MLNLPPQLPEPGPSWHASTPVGLHRHICAYLPSALRFLAQEISSIVPLQVGDNWNISAAQLAGGTRSAALNAYLSYLILSRFPRSYGHRFPCPYLDKYGRPVHVQRIGIRLIVDVDFDPHLAY